MVKAYYLYDKDTHKYIDTVYTGLSQPEGSTTVAPTVELNGITYWLDNAVFNPATNTWTGDNPTYQTQKQVAVLTSTVVQLTQQVAKLANN